MSRMISISDLFAAHEARIKAVEETLSQILSRLTALENSSLPPASAETLVLPPTQVKNGNYLYQTLDTLRNEVRILVVYGGEVPGGERDVICELVHVSLDSDEVIGEVIDGRGRLEAEAVKKFNTLSYTWGSSEKKGSVIIEGRRFPVTENVQSALQTLRNFKDPASKSSSGVTRSFWWIDAICINQEDLSERNQQVNLMTRIYKKAVGVHIWLGEQTDDSEVAFQVARQLADQSPRVPGHPGIQYPDTTAEQRNIHRRALSKLYARPWWERVWIRQEVAVANTATVHCGNSSCSFHALTIAAQIMHKMGQELGFKVPLDDEPSSSTTTGTPGTLRSTPHDRAWILTHFRHNQGREPAPAYFDLRALLINSRSCAATDAHDKVFSILGLADSDWALKADYGRPVRETFILATQRVIERKQSLDILSGCQNLERKNNIPSWVPNLTEGWKARPFEAAPRGSQNHYAEVMAGEAPDFCFSLSSSEPNRERDVFPILLARGWLLDLVDVLSPSTPSQDNSSQELDTISSAWRKLAATALRNKNIDVLDKGTIAKYDQDGPWIQFLSTRIDRGAALPRSAAEIKIPGDYGMAKALLLPDEEEMEGIRLDGDGDGKGLKQRVREWLRKNGVGRRICVTKAGEGKGSVVLVPAESEKGDEIWAFRGTSFPYVLRKVQGGVYVVVGEAYSDRYYWPYLKARAEEIAGIISII